MTVPISPPDPDPGREVLDRLVRIETKLDTALSDVADHEDRIRTLEKEKLTEERVATIAKRQSTEAQASLRGWLMVIAAFLAILSAGGTALFIAVFL